ncbi:MAG: ester cyclase [Pseudomonadota bacterium]
MKGSRPQHGALTKDNDRSKTAETRGVIDALVNALNDHDIVGMDAFFADDFVWHGNAGCGVKHGLKAFQANWQAPFQAAFADKVAVDEAQIVDGQWAASFGRQEAVHVGTFMGIPATGKTVQIRYMDFWKVVDGKIVDNHVFVDFADVMRQLGVDPFQGHGWEAYDEGRAAPPRPAHFMGTE